jgi:hypothetical protein
LPPLVDEDQQVGAQLAEDGIAQVGVDEGRVLIFDPGVGVIPAGPVADRPIERIDLLVRASWTRETLTVASLCSSFSKPDMTVVLPRHVDEPDAGSHRHPDAHEDADPETEAAVAARDFDADSVEG